MKRHIVAISGGGFSEVEHAFIDDYIVNIRRQARKLRIAFVATASNDAEGYIEKFYRAFQHEQPSHFTIEQLSAQTIQHDVNAVDIVYVGGGNTQFMLETWRKAGFHHVLKNAYHNGVILAGVSAGAMCWFDYCLCETANNQYAVVPGLGFLNGSFCPHYNDPVRRAAFDSWASSQPHMYALYDDESLHFQNETVVAKISGAAQR